MPVNRRQFLERAALLPAAAILTADGLHTLRPEQKVPTPISGPAPNYLEGHVVSWSPGLVMVRDRWSAKADPVALRITPQTDICKGACALRQDTIRVGDRVDAGTFDLPDGTRGAPWIVVNLVAFMGIVQATGPNRLVVQRRGHTCTQEVHFLAGSTVRVKSQEFPAATRFFQVGDELMLTGSAELPTDDGVVFATLVIKD